MQHGWPSLGSRYQSVLLGYFRDLLVRLSFEAESLRLSFEAEISFEAE